MIPKIYTDGSHFKHSVEGYIGYGAYCEHLNTIYKMSGKCDNECLKTYQIPPDTKISNPTAEFIAFAEVLRHLSRSSSPSNDFNGKKLIFIIDYEGVKKWMNGEWKTKQPYIRSIKAYCDRLIAINGFVIDIQDVDSHSNNYGNDMADALAKDRDVYSNFDRFVI